MTKNTKLSKLLPLLLITTTYSSLADDMSVKLKGGLDFQAGYFTSNAPSTVPVDNDNASSASVPNKPKNVTQNQKNMAFLSTAYMGVEAKNILENGFEYGVKIGLETTTKSARKIQSGIFMESDYGRVEMGSDKSAMANMRITPYSVAAGSWDSWVKADPFKSKNIEIPYVTGFSNILDQKMRSSGKTEYSRKVTYYTPVVSGFQLGVSYIPDSSNVGYTDIKDTSVKHAPVYSNYYFSVKNGVAAGLTYKTQINKDAGIKLSAVNETGKVIGVPKPGSDAPNVSFGKLHTYNLGAQLTYGKYDVALSYGEDEGQAMLLSDDVNKKTSVYGIGGRYKTDKYAVSLAFFESEHRRNKMQAYTLGADYKAAPGLMPYAEFTYFEAKGRYVGDLTSRPSTHKGIVALLGTKVEF